MNAKALDAQIAKTHEAAELLERLTLYVQDHGEVAPDDVNWAHVGSMGHVVAQLREIVNFIDGKDD